MASKLQAGKGRRQTGGAARAAPRSVEADAEEQNDGGGSTGEGKKADALLAWSVISLFIHMSIENE